MKSSNCTGTTRTLGRCFRIPGFPLKGHSENSNTPTQTTGCMKRHMTTAKMQCRATAYNLSPPSPRDNWWLSNRPEKYTGEDAWKWGSPKIIKNPYFIMLFLSTLANLMYSISFFNFGNWKMIRASPSLLPNAGINSRWWILRVFFGQHP